MGSQARHGKFQGQRGPPPMSLSKASVKCQFSIHWNLKKARFKYITVNSAPLSLSQALERDVFFWGMFGDVLPRTR